MMTCERIRKDNVIENYLMNRLDKSRRKAFEVHIAACVSCRNKLEQEKYFIAGIQKYGREKLKTRLGADITRHKNTKKKTDWTVYYKAAAVLFILVLIPGIVYFNSPFEQQMSEQTGRPAPERADMEERPQSPSQPKDDYKAEEKAKPTQTIELQPIESSSMVSETEQESKIKESEPAQKKSAPLSAGQKSGSSGMMKESGLTSVQKQDGGRIIKRPLNIQRVQAGGKTHAFVSLFRNSTISPLPHIEKQQEETNTIIYKIYFPAYGAELIHTNPAYTVLNDSTIMATMPDSSRYLIELGKQKESIRILKTGEPEQN